MQISLPLSRAHWLMQRDEGFTSPLCRPVMVSFTISCTNRQPAVKRLRSTAAICQDLPLPQRRVSSRTAGRRLPLLTLLTSVHTHGGMWYQAKTLTHGVYDLISRSLVSTLATNIGPHCCSILSWLLITVTAQSSK